jgi:hypothetical protein
MKKSNIKILSLLVLITMSLSSCLNDLEDFIGDFSSTPAIAELSEAANPSTGTVVREIIDPTKPANFKLRVGIAVANALGTDTKVVLAIDNSLVTAYNTSKGLTGSAAAVPVPAAALSTSSMEVVIPAGKLEVDWEFSINAALVPNPVSTFYILPVRIVSAENSVTVSGNLGTKLVRILARNKWDGRYTVTGTYTDYVSPAFVGYYPKTIDLITIGGDMVSRWDVDEEIYGYIFDTGAGLSYFGNWTPTFKFDANDNLIDVINSTPDPLPRGRAAALYTGSGAAANKRLADKSIDVSFSFVQQNVTPVNRGLVKEHFVFVGPR